MTTDLLVYQSPQPLKLLGTSTKDGVEVVRLGGPLVVFSGPEDPDLTGDFFTKDTDFGALTDEGEVTLPAYYHHGLDETLGKKRIGILKARLDDDQVWAEYQIALRNKYLERIAEMAQKTIKTALGEQPALGQSSGAVAHLVEVEKVGGARWLKAWPLGEGSPTPTPAEPRTSAVPLKSLRVNRPDAKSIKAESTTAHLDRIYRAFYSAYDRGYIAEIFLDDGYVIGEVDGDFYRITFREEDSDVVFAPWQQWEAVERMVEYVAAKVLDARYRMLSRGGEPRPLDALLADLKLTNLKTQLALRG